jgi:hypothetical protein
MPSSHTRFRVRIALLAIAVGLSGLAFLPSQADPTRPKPLPPLTPTPQAWTLDAAAAQLGQCPRDPYLQYVVLQLGRRDERFGFANQQVSRALSFTAEPINRRDQVDLYNAFTGALAVQEALQLDTMRRMGNRPTDDRRAREIIDLARLTGPTIKSHPWKTMLGDKAPEVPALAKMVPEDNYIVEFRSLSKLLDLLDNSDLWGSHFFSQTNHEARTQLVGERLKQQLAIDTNPALRPLYDTVIKDVAVTGSDLFLGEGSDVTLIFELQAPEAFKECMSSFLDAARKSHKGAIRTEGEYLGVPYVHVSTPDRTVHVFSAYPEEGLHVRSNSKTGMQRVLDAIKGKDAANRSVARLGESLEYQYIRTLMPHGAKEEDGFIYLSDPFIRRMVGPIVRLTGRRRMLCYNHLRMVGHAAEMFATEFGRPPGSVEELLKAKCLPGPLNEDDFVCPDGGKYTLSADHTTGTCSHHGNANHLVPCCETTLAWATGTEVDEYDAFLRDYNNYWRRYFDPIAIRVQVTPERYRLETIILPLINNSIYQGLAETLNGKPEALDALPVPTRNILTVAGRFNKEAILKQAFGNEDPYTQADRTVASSLGISEEDARKLGAGKVLAEGIGNQVALNICDAEQMFDIELPNFLGLAFANLNGGRGVLGGNQDWLAAFVIGSLNAPVYASVPVRDPKLVDSFLQRLDKVLTVKAINSRNRGGWFEVYEDAYRTKLKDGTPIWGYTVRLWVVKWRFFWGRIGNGLYIASKASLLEDIAATAAAPGRGAVRDGPDTTAHAMLRLRPNNWKRVLDDYRLTWAENNREACLRNIGPVASAARAVRAAHKDGVENRSEAAVQEAARIYGVYMYCPDGGKYIVSEDGTKCTCSIHGDSAEPRQLLAPSPAAGPGKAIEHFARLTATLTFLEDGLHAVVVLDRK